jgi:rapamycin-insensitive companion of mTOR
MMVCGQINQRWVKLGNSLLTTLSSNVEGQRFLQEDQLLRQIVICFAQLDPVRSSHSHLGSFTADAARQF